MKKQVFYIHGGEAFSDYDVFLEQLRNKEIRDLPSLMPGTKWTKTFPKDLGVEYEVFMPHMPNSQNAKYEEWKIWFERHFDYLHDGLVLIGCSLGAMFLVKYFSENDTPFRVKALFIMASPVEVTDFDDEDCGDFIFQLENVHILKNKAKFIAILHSKDDFLVPYEHGVRLYEAIPGSELVTFEDKNHFLIEEFPELVERVKELG